MDRLNAALDSISALLDSITAKIDARQSGSSAGIEEAADQAEVIRGQLEALDASLDRPSEEPPAETPGDVTPEEPTPA